MAHYQSPKINIWLFSILCVLVIGLGLPAAEAYYSAETQPDSHGFYGPCTGGLCAGNDSDLLTWAPPCLQSPTVFHLVVDDSLAVLDMQDDLDYIIELPDAPLPRGLVLQGGRNIVLVGGEIAIPWQGDFPSIEKRTGLQILGAKGTVHIEGLLIRGEDITEGIQIAAPEAIVQIQNVGIFDIHARDEADFTDNHPDLIQTYGGVKELRIDNFTGSSDYQGIFLKADGRTHGSAYLRRVNVIGLSTARYLVWFEPFSGSGNVFLWGVWVDVPAEREGGLGYSIWPDTTGTYPAQARVATSFSGTEYASWPSVMIPQVNGLVIEGVPPEGNFVTPEEVGVGYVSPGYQDGIVCTP